MIREADLVMRAHVDHIISIKHGDPTSAENLAFSCLICNINKGSDIATVLLPDKKPVRFYNPRLELWVDHFELKNGLILPKTIVGEATAKILNLNAPERVSRRQLLIAISR